MGRMAALRKASAPGSGVARSCTGRVGSMPSAPPASSCRISVVVDVLAVASDVVDARVGVELFFEPERVVVLQELRQLHRGSAVGSEVAVPVADVDRFPAAAR